MEMHSHSSESRNLPGQCARLFLFVICLIPKNLILNRFAKHNKMSCLVETAARPSVSNEVQATTKWLLIAVIIKSFCYYFTAYQRNDDIMWATSIFAAIVTTMIFMQFHRMKVAQVRLRLDEGDHEWNQAVFFYTLGVTCFTVLITLLVFSEPKPFQYAQHDGIWCLNEPWDWQQVGDVSAWQNQTAFSEASELCLKYAPFEEKLHSAIEETEKEKQAIVSQAKIKQKEAVLQNEKERILKAQLLHEKNKHSHEKWDRWRGVGAGWTVLLLLTSCLCQFITFVYLIRFERKADERFSPSEL